MNDDRTEFQRRLLNDVLRENGGARQAALSAFRRARLLRRVSRVSVLGLAAGAMAIGLWTQRPESTTSPTTAEIATTADMEINEMPTLTDEELIASFPQGSCFLAEVDGRQVLVFTNPEIERKVLQRRGL